MDVLVGDIGGTNANLGIWNGRKIVFKDCYPSQKIHDFERHLELYLADAKKQGYNPRKIKLAAAGPITSFRDKPQIFLTHVDLKIRAYDLEKKFSLPVTLLNDFEAIGYATNELARSERKIIRVGRQSDGPRVVIGAGTALGKVLMVYDEHVKKYLPVRSEISHTDVPFHNEEELRLGEFIKELEGKKVVTYEDIVSGPGLERLYLYHSHKHLPAHKIMDKKDAPTRDTIADFVKFYARAFRNEIVDNYATGGIYIAGGIAAKNPEIFKGAFLRELARHDKREYRELLSQVPITIITNYDVSLKGVALA